MFDREGRYGDRFFCTSHYNTIWLYGWKKYDQVGGENQQSSSQTVTTVDVGKGHRASSQQVGSNYGASRRLRKKYENLLLILGEMNVEGKNLGGEETPADIQEEVDLLGATGLAPVKSTFYILFCFLLFAISYIFNPPEIHNFIVSNLDLVSET